MGVTTCDMIVERLKVLHSTSGLSWRSIANLDEYRGIPPGTLNRIAKHGYIPYKWHYQFGLPGTERITEIAGVIVVPLSQVGASSRECTCGQFFIPNHPKRRRCFTCRPIQKSTRPTAGKRS